jgi:formylglycine-generating enzyme required for sulfatase activity
MVVIPPGSFTMGSSPSETSREGVPDKFAAREKPSHGVRVGAPLAVGMFLVTRAEFARFVQATGYSPIGSCEIYDGSKWNYEVARSWRDPGFPQSDRDPVVCVSWDDARAYVQFLSRETGRFYRLLTEAEWEYAARGGRSTTRWWGDSSADQCRYANGADETAKRRFPDWTVAACRNGYVFTSPVGSFAANPFGLHDMLGNAKQWVEDCWRKDYDRAPADAAVAVTSGDCGGRVRRGGSWSDNPWGLRAATRFDGSSGDRGSNIGFRVARKPAG